MFKKIMALVLVIALTATVAVGATVAYLTDRDSEANVFTVGDVSIKLTEDYAQGATLIPGVKIEKDVKIENTGKNNAWVWVQIALPAVLDGGQDASKNVVHFNYSKDSTADWTWLKDDSGNWVIGSYTDANDIAYNVYTVMYNNTLAPNATTNTSAMYQVYMDTRVDIDPDGNMFWVEKGEATDLNWDVNTYSNPVMYVSAYAAQAEGFNDAKEAYVAYNAQWTTAEGVNNGLEWGAPATVIEVTDLDGVKDAIANANGEPIIIDANGADLGDVDEVTFSDGSVLKDATFSGVDNYGNDVNGTVTFTGCTFTATNAYAAHFDGGNGEIIFVDCHFEGWNSFGTAVTGLTFKNCTFGSNGTYGLVRVYQDATFENCTFETALEGVDTNVTGTTVHFNNCSGIEGKIHNNGANVGIWFIDGVDVSSTATSW